MTKRILCISFFSLLIVSAKGQFVKNTLAKDTITDHNIKIPVDLDRNFDQLVVDWKKSKKKIPICDKIDDGDVTYSDAEYEKRLHALPTRMELAYNQIVRSYIEMYAGRHRHSVEYMLAANKYYGPIIESALDKYNLPLELKYLTVIESAFNPNARSRAGATGLWQFMIGTGRMYDLEVNSLVDERRDPRKSSEAAARYLTDLYKIYNDWNLVIAAYNCGPGNVNKAIRRSGGQADYWTIYPYLPRETRGYVPAFIAATYIMNYYDKHNICPVVNDMPISTDTLMINHTVQFEQIASVLNIPIEEIRALNPKYTRDIIPGEFKTYDLTLPSNKVAEYVKHRKEIWAYHEAELLPHRIVVEPTTIAVNQTRTITHKVRRGETLAGIARKYGVSSHEIRKLNRLRSNHVRVGSHLIIKQYVTTEPTKKTQPTKIPEKANAPTSTPDSIPSTTPQSVVAGNTQGSPTITDNQDMHEGNMLYHKVQDGETVDQLAAKYNVSVLNIEKWNNLTTPSVASNQRLLIYLPQSNEQTAGGSDAEPDTQKQATPKTERGSRRHSTQKTTRAHKKQTIYVVRKGDDLSTIAKKHHVTVKQLKAANGLRRSKLKRGQKLTIPQR